MNGSTPILQIVPQPPGQREGVGDYALIVARKLRAEFSCGTVFATANRDVTPSATREFPILPLSRSIPKQFQHIILHYVSYGYHKRGVPLGLLSVLRELRRQCRGRLVTVFHELYASGPPWKSAFWLQPFQIGLVKTISRLSDASIVSSEAMKGQLWKLTPKANVRVQPVPSNFGEPMVSTEQLSDRSPHRWVICGGTLMVERALRSFLPLAGRITPHVSPHELIVLGGSDNPRIHASLADLSNIRTEYHPEIEVSEASEILKSCSFAWFDYFDRPNVPTDAILKSGVFAAACAHGVIPVFPHHGSIISLQGDCLPGPFFVAQSSHNLPRAEEREKVAAAFYDWYVRHASAEHLVHGIARDLGLQPGQGEYAIGHDPFR